MSNRSRNTNIETNPQIHLDGFLAEFRQAIQDEIKELQKHGQSSILLTEGHRLYTASGYWYQFKIDYIPNIPADTPCKLTIGNESHEASVVAFDDDSITIDVKDELPNTIAEAKLDNGATVLMELLIKRIESNSSKENPAGQRMMSAINTECKRIDDNETIELDNQLKTAQINAIRSAVCNNITFIWGPPGTGKTTVISHVIMELLKRDRSVMLVSHTNSAVNGAIKKVDEKYYTEKGDPCDIQYPILRLGSGGKELDERLQIDSHIEKVSHDLLLQKAQIEKEYSDIQQVIGELQTSLTKLNWVNNTKIDTLEYYIRKRSDTEASIELIKEKLFSLDTAIQHKIEEHPEYKESDELKQTIERAEQTILTLNKQIESNEHELSSVSDKITEADDEIATHKQFNDLTERLKQYFSSNLLSTKINECKAKISSLEKVIANNKKRIALAEDIIQKYDSRSSLGKLFANKNEYEQSKTTSDRLNKANEVNRNSLEATKLNLQNYEKQVIERTAINNQLNDIHPSKTEVYWENEKIKYNAKKKELLESLRKDKELLSETISEKDNANTKLNIISSTCSEIEDLIRDRKNTQIEKQGVLSKYEYYNTMVINLVSDEYQLCYGLYMFPENISIDDIENAKQKIQYYKAETLNLDSLVIEKDISSNNKKLNGLDTELKQLDEHIAKISTQVVVNAKVIGTTLAKSYLSDEIQSCTFDTIILDEASMASIPALWCASQLAAKNIVIVGDFLQLPPIVIAETDMAKKWLGKDIFEVSGAQNMFKIGKVKQRPDNFVMLNEQFRMKKEIADIVNIYYKQYSGLQSNDKAADFAKKENGFKEWYNYKLETEIYTSFKREHCIHLMDTGSLNAWVTSVPTGVKNHSRLNAFSAVLSVELAFKLLEKKFDTLVEPEKDPLILIVAPYKPHVKRIEQIILDKYHSLGYADDMNLIKAGTIHSFQGKEAAIVIFDLVIDEPHYLANMFMQTEEVNAELQKMFNVAISRAKYKLFFVGNFDYCKKKARTNALGSLLNYLITKKNYPVIDAKRHFPNMTFSKPSSKGLPQNDYMMEICKEDIFLPRIKADIQNASNQIIIYSPFMTEKAISPLLPLLQDATNRHCTVIVVTKTVEEIAKGEQNQKQKCESELVKCGLQIIHKKGMHEKIMIIDSDTVWIGSLNMLSFGGKTGEIMCKIISREGAKEFADLYDIEHIIQSVNNESERICPLCGKEVIMAESDSVGYYWHCIDKDGCGWSRKPGEPYPHDGKLVCPKCGEDFAFSMVNEPRWVCNSGHYRKIRKADLKLVKMWNDVPQMVVKEVEDYFNTLKTELETNKPKQKSKSNKRSSNKTDKKVKTLDLFSIIDDKSKINKNKQLSIF